MLGNNIAGLVCNSRWAMDFLKSAVASAISKEPSFPYKFGDKLTVDQSIWALHNGTKRVCVLHNLPPYLSDSCPHLQENGSDCSIFAFDVTADRSRLPLARNAVRKMRTLRHPGVIKVYDTIEVLQPYREDGAFGDADIHDRPRHTSTLLRRESLL